MAVPVKPKYPLFLKDIGKCDCESNGSESGVVGGYPIVTVEDNLNIDAKPNTFYDIKNPINSEIIIICNQLEVAPTRIYFTYDGSDSDSFGSLLLFAGLNIIPDNTKEGYSYKALVNAKNLSGGAIDVLELYFTNNIIQGGSTNIYFNLLGQDVSFNVNNINIIKTENIINEFIFNFICPCTIQFGNTFSWNNDNAPDLTQEGICTISIVNGVACYTFVKT